MKNKQSGNSLSLGSLIAVRQVTTVWEIKTHKSVMWSHNSLVDLEVCWRTTQALNIDTPFLGVQVECLESTSLAGQLNRVDVLVSTVVSSTWVSLRVFVWHGWSQSIEDGTGGNILGGNEDDRFTLTLDLKILRFLSVNCTNSELCIYEIHLPWSQRSQDRSRSETFPTSIQMVSQYFKPSSTIPVEG